MLRTAIAPISFLGRAPQWITLFRAGTIFVYFGLDSLDDSLDSSAADNAAPTPARETLTRKLLKGKIQAGVQKRVNDFWSEKVGGYIMQGDYLALHMEEKSCLTWKSYL